MEILLDTHALVWWLESAPALSKRAATLIASKQNLILISPAVAWELAIKSNLGKFRTSGLVHDLGELVAREGFVELPINLSDAVRAGFA